MGRTASTELQCLYKGALYLSLTLFSMLNVLYCYNITFRNICTVPLVSLSRSPLISCFPGMLLMYFVNDFEVVPVAPVIYW